MKLIYKTLRKGNWAGSDGSEISLGATLRRCFQLSLAPAPPVGLIMWETLVLSGVEAGALRTGLNPWVWLEFRVGVLLFDPKISGNWI